MLGTNRTLSYKVRHGNASRNRLCHYANILLSSRVLKISFIMFKYFHFLSLQSKQRMQRRLYVLFKYFHLLPFRCNPKESVNKILCEFQCEKFSYTSLSYREVLIRLCLHVKCGIMTFTFGKLIKVNKVTQNRLRLIAHPALYRPAFYGISQIVLKNSQSLSY